jgi:NACalpha-BTF3-like transcription factor
MSEVSVPQSGSMAPIPLPTLQDIRAVLLETGEFPKGVEFISAVFDVQGEVLSCTDGQRALIAEELATVGQGRPKNSGIPEFNYTREQAALKLGVTTRHIDAIRRIRIHRADCIQKIKSGELGLWQAHERAKKVSQEAQAAKRAKNKKSTASLKPNETMEELLGRLDEKDTEIIAEWMQETRAEIRDEALADAYEKRQENAKESALLDERRKAAAEREKMLREPWTKQEYQLILQVAHPDRHTDELMKKKCEKIFPLISKLKPKK